MNDVLISIRRCDIDEHDNLMQCFNTVTRPPQSWCYVEALK